MKLKNLKSGQEQALNLRAQLKEREAAKTQLTALGARLGECRTKLAELEKSGAAATESGFEDMVALERRIAATERQQGKIREYLQDSAKTLHQITSAFHMSVFFPDAKDVQAQIDGFIWPKLSVFFHEALRGQVVARTRLEAERANIEASVPTYYTPLEFTGDVNCDRFTVRLLNAWEKLADFAAQL